MGFSQEGSKYAKNTLDLINLIIISPCNYKFTQDGLAFRSTDLLSGAQFQTNGTPAPGVVYHQKIAVLESGLPKVTPLYEDPSEEKKHLDNTVKAFEAISETLFKGAATLAQATCELFDPSVIVIAATAGVGFLAGAVKVSQQAMQARIDELEAASKRYVFKEDIQRMVGASGQASPESLRNRQIFESKLGFVLPLDLSNNDYFVIGINQWADIIRLITDFYIISDSIVKAKVCDGLEALFNNVIKADIAPSTLIPLQTALNTFIDAYNNPYLTGLGNPEDEAIRDKWYGWISNISSKLITSPLVNERGMPIKFKGEYFWFPVKFQNTESGSVTFEVKASQDVFVALGEGPYRVRNSNNRIYEIVFGKWNNKITAIHRKSLGDAVVEFDQKKFPGLSPDPTTFKKYWIDWCKGVFSCGFGEHGQNKQFEWTDPYLMPPIICVGFSNWNREILIKNIKVGDSILTTSKRRVVVPSAKTTKIMPPKADPNAIKNGKQVIDKNTTTVKPMVVPKISVDKSKVAVPAA